MASSCSRRSSAWLACSDVGQYLPLVALADLRHEQLET
jgi:hypothetical protein